MNTTTKTLYINDNGLTTCRTHAGAELAAELDARPTAFEISTPLGTWIAVDAAELPPTMVCTGRTGNGCTA